MEEASLEAEGEASVDDPQNVSLKGIVEVIRLVLKPWRKEVVAVLTTGATRLRLNFSSQKLQLRRPPIPKILKLWKTQKTSMYKRLQYFIYLL